MTTTNTNENGAGGKAVLSLSPYTSAKRRTNGKLGLDQEIQPQQLPNQPLRCPECGSQAIIHSGFRFVSREGVKQQVQRYYCKLCGYRFSEPSKVEYSSSQAVENVENLERLSLRSTSTIDLSGRVCAEEIEAKNLSTPTETKTVGGDREEVKAHLGTLDAKAKKGLLLQYALYLDKEGYGANCKYTTCIRMLLNSEGCDIYNPDKVKAIISKKKWKDGTKMQAAYAYDAFTRMAGLSWTMPSYRQEDFIFFLPQEDELDTLISATTSARLRAYLQSLKETFADPEEVLRIGWEDVDTKRGVIAINHPVKDHLAGEFEVSPKLLNMLDALPKTSTKVFPTTYRNMQSIYIKLRRRAAARTQNPRLLKVSFVSFRHWAGTQLAWLFNGNMLIVKEKLRHRNINSTMKYVRRIKLTRPEDYDVFTASTDEEIKQMGMLGAQKYDERTVAGTVISYYRRPKALRSSIKV